MNREIGISAASKILGVSISTLKRLCDENLIPTIRTPGGHRRFDRTEMELVGQRLAGPSPRLASKNPAGLNPRIAALLLAGNSHGLTDLLSEQLAHGLTLPLLLDQNLVPVLDELATAENDSSTLVRLARHTAARTINQWIVQQTIQWSGPPTCLGVSLGTGANQLASKLVEAALRSIHIHALHIDAQLDVEVFSEAVTCLQVETVWAACWYGTACSETSNQLEQLRAQLPQHTRLMVYAVHSANSGLYPPSMMNCYTSLQSLCLNQRFRQPRLIERR